MRPVDAADHLHFAAWMGPSRESSLGSLGSLPCGVQATTSTSTFIFSNLTSSRLPRELLHPLIPTKNQPGHSDMENSQMESKQLPPETVHLALNSQCGICGFQIAPGRRVTLIVEHGLRGCAPYTTPFDFPVQPTLPKCCGCILSRLHHCKGFQCSECHDSPEAATVHIDCFSLFKREASIHKHALRRLFQFSIWRTPWKNTPTTGLRESSAVSRPTLALLAEKLGFHNILCRLPEEIICDIREASEDAPLWSIGRALDLVKLLSAPPSGDLVAMPLDEVICWKRGDLLPTTSTTMKPLPVIRLTLDSVGLSKVERFSPADLQFQPAKVKDVMFVRAEGKQLTGVLAQFRDGMLRLHLPSPHPGFPIWDTPTPFGSPYNKIRSCITRTADLTRATGLTFFLKQGTRFAGLHVHTPRAPFAELLPGQPGRDRICWVYVPIPPGDQILAFASRSKVSTYIPPGAKSGSRFGTQFVVRTKRIGDISIGCCHYIPIPMKKVVVNPKVLMSTYSNVPEQDHHRWAAANEDAHASNDDVAELAESMCIAYTYGLTRQELSPVVNFSVAPIEGVTCATVFRHGTFGNCRGILFEYLDGTQRAVGECRLGFDPCTVYHDPSAIYHQPCRAPCVIQTSKLCQAVRIKFLTGGAKPERMPCPTSQTKWHPMRGSIGFTFYPGSILVELTSPPITEWEGVPTDDAPETNEELCCRGP